MTLIRLIYVEYLAQVNDDVPDESEWHAPDPFGEATACGLAHGVGATSRDMEYKEGTIRSVTCQICKRVIAHYKALK